MKTIVFMGDSITDCGRSKDGDTNFGNGYATMVKAKIGLEYPSEYCFYNRGFGGERIHHILSRFNNDMAKLKPDYLSILVGINDIWSYAENKEYLKYDHYGELYDILLCDLKKELPETEIFLMEPFCLNGYATADNEIDSERYSFFKTQCKEKSEIVRKLSEKHNLSFMPLQEKFDSALEKIKSEDLSYDGIHPTAIGHGIIAEEWIKMFEKVKNQRCL